MEISLDSRYSVHPQLPFLLGEGVEPLIKFSKREGLDRISIFWGGFWEKGSDFFHGGRVAVFKEEINENLKYLITKKFISENVFFFYNQESKLGEGDLSKNLVTFKRWEGIKNEEFKIMEVHREIFLEGVYKKTIYVRA